MDNFDTSVMEQEMPEQLAEVLCIVTDLGSMQSLLRDVMTEKEIIEISARFEAAKMLTAGETYTAVIKRTKLSSRTVARISEWLQKGTGGYAAAIEMLQHAHTQPDRAA